MKSIDNFEEIKKLLSWNNQSEYYYVQLYLRKKDATTTFGNKNQSARIIKTYQFFNLEQLLSKKEEIIKLCELVGCRAGINLNKRNEKDILLNIITESVERIKSNNYKGINGILNTVNGKYKGNDKIWIIDCDSQSEMEVTREILENKPLRPEGKKILSIVPTYSGYHIITTRFDILKFNQYCKSLLSKYLDIHKNNFVALYYPEIYDKR